MAARTRTRKSPAARPRAIQGEVLLDEKTARRLRLARWRRLVISAGLIGVVVGGIALYVSPVLRVQRVQVVGATTVDPARVVELAALEGDSMFNPGTDAARERIEYLPMVQSVEISRHWPQTVRIQIIERAPWGYWRVADQDYVIDAEGVVLSDERPPDGAPVIKDLSNPVRLVPGDHVDADAVALTQALLQRLPAELALSIAALEYSPASGLAVTTDAGYRVVVGDSQNIDYKLAVWKEIEGQLGRDEMAGHVLDLRFGDRPAFQ